MRIAILGAGAMGMLFGGYLSRQNDVFLIDVDQSRVEKIRADGVVVSNEGRDEVFHPKAGTRCAGLDRMDLVIVFVKSM